MGKMLVFSNAVEGRDDEYNDWYDTIHLKEVLSIPAFTSAKRFRVPDASPEQSHRYLAIYEYEGSAEDAINSLFAATGSMNISEALNAADAKIVLVEEQNPA